MESIQLQVNLFSITVRGAFVYETNIFDRALNQSAERVLDGTLKVYNMSEKSIRSVELNIKSVPEADAEALKAFIKDTLLYRFISFSIIPISTLDVGNGRGVTISSCNLKTESTDGLFRRVPPYFYDVVLPYEFLVDRIEP